MDSIVWETLRKAISEAQSLRAAAQDEIDRLRAQGEVEMDHAEGAFSRLAAAEEDLRCLQKAYEDLGGDPTTQFS